MASRYGFSLADVESAAAQNVQRQQQMSDWKKGRETEAQVQEIAGQMETAETPEERRGLTMQMATLSPEKATGYANFYEGLNEQQRAEARRINDEGRKAMAYVQDVVDSGGDPQQAWNIARKHAPAQVSEFMTETYQPGVHKYGLVHFAEIDQVNKNLDSRRDQGEAIEMEGVRQKHALAKEEAKKDRKETAPTKYSRYGKKELRDNIRDLLTTQETDALGEAVEKVDAKQVQKVATRVEALRKENENMGDDELLTMVLQEMDLIPSENAPPPGSAAVGAGQQAIQGMGGEVRSLPSGQKYKVFRQ